jgi:hypothetical protein
MSNSRWKKYGGIDRLENNNNLSVHSLIADSLTLRTAYSGRLDVDGELYVNGIATIVSDLNANNCIIKNNINTNKLFSNEVDVSGDIIVKNDAQINNNLIVNGVIKAKDKLYIGG